MMYVPFKDEQKLKEELARVLNRFGVEREAEDTPDWILAELIVSSIKLYAFTAGLRDRMADRERLTKMREALEEIVDRTRYLQDDFGKSIHATANAALAPNRAR